MMTDPLADMLTRIRNAGQAGLRDTRCPSSKLKLAVAQVLRDEGFINQVEVQSVAGKPNLLIGVRYDDYGAPMIMGLRRVSRPSRRVYVGAEEIPKVRNGLGVAILSTSRGILSDRSARSENVGGEILCEVW